MLPGTLGGHGACLLLACRAEGQRGPRRLRGEHCVARAGGVRQLTPGRYTQGLLRLRAGGSKMPPALSPWEASHCLL